jgi:hypothetical protein
MIRCFRKGSKLHATLPGLSKKHNNYLLLSLSSQESTARHAHVYPYRVTRGIQENIPVIAFLFAVCRPAMFYLMLLLSAVFGIVNRGASVVRGCR